MSDEIITPLERQKNDNTTVLIVILAIVLIFICCCCLIFLLVGWFVGDYVINWIRIVLDVGSLLSA
jgi:hypothetical protein